MKRFAAIAESNSPVAVLARYCLRYACFFQVSPVEPKPANLDQLDRPSPRTTRNNHFLLLRMRKLSRARRRALQSSLLPEIGVLLVIAPPAALACAAMREYGRKDWHLRLPVTSVCRTTPVCTFMAVASMWQINSSWSTTLTTRVRRL